ncbi:MAG TPA: ArsR family transcriptional regulator [Desulfobacteraceae bacterium]|nr:ArsR family transcriptional regulator [Desulfobacteraceae bacterium]
MEMFIKVMKALSDVNRVRILKMLQHKNMCVCELQAALRIAQPTVSKHLKILLDSGLVQCSRDGKWIDYRLSDGSGSPFPAVMLGNLRHWLDQNPTVSADVRRLPELCRENLCGLEKD